MLLCFQSKISSNWFFLFFFFAFYSDLVPPFYFVKWNRFFSTIIPVLSESRHYFSYLLSREVFTNLQIKRFPLMKLWYTIWIYGSTEFQNNNIKKHPPHTYSFWNYLSRNLLIIKADNHNLALIIAERFTKKSRNSISLFVNMTPLYRQIKALPSW